MSSISWLLCLDFRSEISLLLGLGGGDNHAIFVQIVHVPMYNVKADDNKGPSILHRETFQAKLGLFIAHWPLGH